MDATARAAIEQTHGAFEAVQKFDRTAILHNGIPVLYVSGNIRPDEALKLAKHVADVLDENPDWETAT